MAVRRVKGVQKMTSNVKERTMSVELGPEAETLDELYEAMARIGYNAEEI
jgi:copper chaperone CopZ